jgi:hypothetical protein
MLLKEMQMIKEGDKNNNSIHISVSSTSNLSIHQQQQSQQQFSSPISPSSSSPNNFLISSAAASITSNIQSYLYNNCNNTSKNQNSNLSGTNTITNSPSQNISSSYLTDLSNTKDYHPRLNQHHDGELDDDDENVIGVIQQKRKQTSSLNSAKLSRPVVMNQENSGVLKTLDTSKLKQKTDSYMLKYAFDRDFDYTDFDLADQSLRLEYYTWENGGYITGYSILPDICELLDKNFRIASQMTYNTMGYTFKQVDTSLFRRAVWHYIHELFGVKYDDYDYSQIKCLLKSPLRKYIKYTCVCPERVTKKHYDSIMKEFTHSEKVIDFYVSQFNLKL